MFLYSTRPDYNVGSLSNLLDMVKVMQFALSEGKVAVHCHAGLGEYQQHFEQRQFISIRNTCTFSAQACFISNVDVYLHLSLIFVYTACTNYFLSDHFLGGSLFSVAMVHHIQGP